ncbi:MAG: ATP-dependent helicase, partial [Polyangiaceae bacterium]
RGIGETSVERLALHSVARGWSLWQGVERVDAMDDISGAARDGCKDLERIIGEVRKTLLVDQGKASEATRALCERIGLKSDIDASSASPKIAGKRWANVESLFQTLARREAREGVVDGRKEEHALGAFLHALTLNFDDAEENTGDAVTLSTLHGSKGLEFDVVFLIGCEEGLLPHSRTIDSRATDDLSIVRLGSDQIEEERRLFYVGVTRARDTLVLSRCKFRAMRGKPVSRVPSRFLMDLPEEWIVEREVKDQPPLEQTEMAANANAFMAMLDSIGK